MSHTTPPDSPEPDSSTPDSPAPVEPSAQSALSVERALDVPPSNDASDPMVPDSQISPLADDVEYVEYEATGAQAAASATGSVIAPPDESLNAVAHLPATAPPSKIKRRRRRADPSPRFLVIFFCLWLLGAWFIALSSTSMVRPIQWMVLCSFFCVMAFWPVLRLSQHREVGDLDHTKSADSSRTPGKLFIDWLCLNLVFQTILWPLHMNAHWHHNQTWWISATLASWSLITGAIIAIGCRSDRPIHRTLAALLCILLLVGEPILLVVMHWIPALSSYGLGHGPVTFYTSPLALVWELTSSAATWGHQPWLTQVPAAALAGVTAWLVVIATRRWTGDSGEPLPPVSHVDATLR